MIETQLCKLRGALVFVARRVVFVIKPYRYHVHNSSTWYPVEDRQLAFSPPPRQ